MPDAQDGNEITRSDHAADRADQGRPVGTVVNDMQRAGPGDVFIQIDDGRYVVRGRNAREHLLEPDGKHLTTVRHRTAAAHRGRLRSGIIRPATDAEFAAFKRLLGGRP